MKQKSSHYLNRLPVILRYGAAAQFVLFGFDLSAVFGFASNRPAPDFP